MFKGVVYNEMKGVFVSLFLLLSSHPVFVDLFVLFKKNIREKQWGNQEWTILRHRQHWAQETER